ncbi:MAG: NAD(P)/FAD-dependent oxidoreductase [Acidobacteria bacterium]|nr:NAD(P)/FAD-dependent oxidoreductase [Acidobacteriota bacterium]
MKDFDVVVIGGGINGLTAAAYLAKAGMRVGVFERRGQCGAHCDTVEIGLPGFLHNLHATWLITAMSPVMEDLELERHGLDLVGTEVVYAKTFADASNCLLGMDLQTTAASVARSSEKDADTVQRCAAYFLEHWGELLGVMHSFFFEPPSGETLAAAERLTDGLLRHLGLHLETGEVTNMTGFEALETLFESDRVRTMLASFGWIGGLSPLHRRIGVLGALLFGALAGPLFPVHQARGGSHALTHALVRCVVAHGGEVWTTCAVERILLEGGRAHAIRMAPDALRPGEEVRARAVISNLTVAPTFLRLLGEDTIGSGWASRIRTFTYDEQVLVGVYYALSGDPVFASAEWDPGIQRCMMGFFGGDTMDAMRRGAVELVSGVVGEEILGNWFVPTRADPSQAPAGHHTSFVWVDVPPAPRRWGGRRLNGWDEWHGIAGPIADAVTGAYERHAPGFRDLVLERFVMTPADQERNNPSAVRGNWIGGAITPDQFFLNRPVPGVLSGGASRTFVPGLYLSNSIHPGGTTWLASGYLAAREVAEDLGAARVGSARAFDWYLGNQSRIPRDLGVGERWRTR